MWRIRGRYEAVGGQFCSTCGVSGGGTRPLEGSSVALVAYPGGGTRPLEGSSVALVAYPGGGTRPLEGSSVALVAYPGEVRGRWRAVL